MNYLGGYTSGHPGGLLPNYQYEVSIPNIPADAPGTDRADLLYYPDISDSQPTQIQVVEAKGQWENRDQTEAARQAAGYVAGLNITESGLYGPGSQHAVLGTWLQVRGYTDAFRIELDRCRSSDTQDRYEHYTVTAPLPGLLWVTRSYDPCQNPNDPRPASDEAEEGLSSSEQDRLPKLVEASSGGASGDPHLTTLDGLRYDLQSQGEFHLAMSPRYGLDVQARLAPESTWSALDAVAMSVGDRRVELRRDGTVLLDGQPATLAAGESVGLGAGGYLFRGAEDQPLEYYVEWPGDGDRPVLGFKPISVSALVGLYYPPGPSDLSGLLGNADGNPGNDLVLRDGTPLGANPSPATVHGSYADSWRISDADSAFTYDPGKDTASYTDLSFPPSIQTIDDLAPSARQLSISTCTQQGVLPGPQFDDCVLDIARTQNDQFAELAGEYRTPLIGLGDAQADTTGTVSADFEGPAVPPNFDAGQLTSDPNLSSFAGPFSGEGSYRFYVPNLPAHLQASVSFELIALGDWTDTTVESLSLAVDQTPVWSQAFGDASPQLTPTGAGATTTGVPYTTYRVTVPLEHHDRQLAGVISASGVDGLAGKAFGIDNLSVHVEVVAPEVFSLGLLAVGSPATVTQGAIDGAAAPGAGQLETMVSADVYRFSLAQDMPLELSQTCPEYAENIAHVTSWKIARDDGAVLYTGDCTSTGQPSYDLTAGNYQVTVSGNLDQPYTLGLQLQPHPQAFGLGTLTTTTPLTASDGLVNGAAAPGAGNLETALSQDQYSFSTAAPGALLIDRGGAPAVVGQPWTLVTDSPASTQVASGSSASDGIASLPAGSYRLLLGSSTVTHATGTYSLTLSLIQPQHFDLASLTSTTPTLVTQGLVNGVATPGAGYLETRVSADDYSFTLEQDSTLGLAQTCPWYVQNIAHVTYWSITGDDGTTRYSSDCTNNAQSSYPLPTGAYHLVVTGNLDQPYSLRLQLQPPAQSFDLGTLTSTAPLTVSDGLVNGSAAAGAGNWETALSQDQYSFTTTESGNLLVERTADGSILNQAWTLLTDTGGWAGGGASATDGITALPAGSYRLIFGSQTSPHPTGSYTLKLSLVQPQHFDLGTLTPGSPVTVSQGLIDGAAAPGAGYLETMVSTDQYSFTLGQNSTITLTQSCPWYAQNIAHLTYWKIARDDGTVLNTGDCTTQPPDYNLTTGTYQLIITGNLDQPYTLQLSLRPPGSQ